MLPREPEVVLKQPEVTENPQLSYILLFSAWNLYVCSSNKDCSTECQSEIGSCQADKCFQDCRSLPEVGRSEESMLIFQSKNPWTRTGEIVKWYDFKAKNGEDAEKSVDITAILEEFRNKVQEMFEKQEEEADTKMKQ